ncbi:hypothetical protein BY458DRAFT_507685 [Sporodiniella umbellata]|nr:hypothetical protein BY458DRAFT_507685 [Sporodiniella umbellata]
MKVSSQLLGRYSANQKPLILFRLPDIDNILLYRLSDIIPLFELPLNCFAEGHYTVGYKDHEDTYLSTTVLRDLAHRYNRPLLSQLAQLKADDYQNGLVDTLLGKFPAFVRAPKEEHVWESVQLPLEKINEASETEIKVEPMSPPSMPEARSAMALDKVLLSTNELKRQSLMDHANKQKTVGNSLQYDLGNVEREKRRISLSSSSSRHSKKLNLMEEKRLSTKHKNALNLTIFAPSYQQQLAGVKSAPINSDFSKAVLQQAQHPKSNLSRSNGGGTRINSTANVPATARPTFARSPKRHEFAIPPIVPSQQQPPHSAHPISREIYVPYRSRNLETIATSASNVPLPPKTPTTSSFAVLQRQQYLQPFEHLFDTIETTRTLKTTLDDQIRRSSSLMQTLQASATTIEGLVRNQVKEVQWEYVTEIEKKIDTLVRRVEALENRLSGPNVALPSPLPSATREERAVAEDLVAMSAKRDKLQTPPTIVRSQHDIGPHEYQNMLTTLRDRLDKLERQFEN